jgi:hypothetical protein
MPVRNYLHTSDIADTSGDDDIRSDGASNANSSHSSLSTDAAALASTAHSGSKTDEEEEESRQKLNLARKETAAVFRLRLLVFVVLLLAALGVSVIVYLITARAEQDEYRTQYEGIAKKVTESFLDIADSKLAAISAFGVALNAHGVDHGAFRTRAR